MIDQLETTILTSLQYLYDELGWLGVALIMVVENATGAAPGEVVLGFAGWMLIDAHGLPFSTVFLGGLFAALGSVIGASILYWSARIGGRPLVDRVVRIFRLDMHHMERVERMAEKHGTKFVFIARMLPAVRTLAAIPAGLTRMSFPAFVIATFGGAYIWCTIFIGLGYFLGHEWHILSAYLKQAAPYGMVAGLLGGIGFLIWRFWFREKLIPVKVNPD